MLKKAIVIDGNSLFYRMYYATTNLVDFAKANNLIPNNAIKMMMNIILKYLNNDKYDYFFIAFDAKAKTFRHSEFDDYKKNRVKAPDELYLQMADTIEAIDALGIKVMQKPGIEADDLVGSFVKLMSKNGILVDILSSDKDLLQLVDNNCTVYLIKKGISELDEYNIVNFKDKFFGLLPNQVIEYKAIVGDTSDCLPGIKGIGPKTGINLLQQYGNLENIFLHLSELSEINKQKFIKDKEIAFKCRELAKILTNEFDNNYSVDEFLLKKMCREKLLPIIKKYKLKNLEEYVVLNIQDSLFNKE